MTTATAKAIWPTAAELERVAALLSKAGNALDELHLAAFRFTDDLDDVVQAGNVPTLEDIGRLSWFIAGAEMDLLYMRKHLDHVVAARDGAALHA